jgi:hypothetical protein
MVVIRRKKKLMATKKDSASQIINDLQYQLDTCKRDLVLEQERSNQFLQEIRYFEEEVPRLQWLVNHLTDQLQDNE